MAAQPPQADGSARPREGVKTSSTEGKPNHPALYSAPKATRCTFAPPSAPKQNNLAPVPCNALCLTCGRAESPAGWATRACRGSVFNRVNTARAIGSKVIQQIGLHFLGLDAVCQAVAQQASYHAIGHDEKFSSSFFD